MSRPGCAEWVRSGIDFDLNRRGVGGLGCIGIGRVSPVHAIGCNCMAVFLDSCVGAAWGFSLVCVDKLQLVGVTCETETGKNRRETASDGDSRLQPGCLEPVSSDFLQAHRPRLHLSGLAWDSLGGLGSGHRRLRTRQGQAGSRSGSSRVSLRLDLAGMPWFPWICRVCWTVANHSVGFCCLKCLLQCLVAPCCVPAALVWPSICPRSVPDPSHACMRTRRSGVRGSPDRDRDSRFPLGRSHLTSELNPRRKITPACTKPPDMAHGTSHISTLRIHYRIQSTIQTTLPRHPPERMRLRIEHELRPGSPAGSRWRPS